MKDLGFVALVFGAFVCGGAVVGLGMVGLLYENTQRAYGAGFRAACAALGIEAGLADEMRIATDAEKSGRSMEENL